MSTIELSGITKRWGEAIGVDDVSFRVDEGTFAILLGPSGCGKSTTLRMIAGLEDVSDGTLTIGGNDMTFTPASARKLSMVFQSYALFPHLDVEENILFGLKVRKTPKSEMAARLRKVAEIVGLSGLLDRKPSQLSGGQRQRVALARAIIAENPICLMDEPLSNLDAKLRQEMRIEIRALQQRLGMTVIYVTHDQAEAMSMGDKVILLRDGKIEQEGAPGLLYDKPATAFAASFIGTPPMNLLRTVSGGSDTVIDGAGDVPVLAGAPAERLFGIRPEHMQFVDTGGIEVELVSADYLGSETIVAARIGDQNILVQAPGHVRVPEPVWARVAWNTENVHVFDAGSGRRDDSVRALPI
ncbi:MAG: ABC transporter ATP-binding protein [Rhodospirillales bacterium]